MKKLPYIEVEFNKEGTLHKPEIIDVVQFVEKKKLTDLFVISHGWNNDMKEARDLYARLIDLFAEELQNNSSFQTRSFGVLGVLWPSKKFTNEELIPGGGAASLAGSSAKQDLLATLKLLKNSFDKTDSAQILDEAKKAVQKLDINPEQASKDFVAQMAKLIAGITGKSTEPEDKIAREFQKESAKALLIRLQDTPKKSSSKNKGGAASISAAAGGIGEGFQNLFEGARNLLNYVTYYQMKERAGKVGKRGLAPALKEIKKSHPDLRLHLIGHSFGARLVTSTASNLGKGSVDTLILLQAAFSHYGFAHKYSAGDDGMFRPAIVGQKVKGNIIITHTHNDTAVGKAYAIASRVGRQTGSFLGGPNDLYGGMGANGAQITPEASSEFSLSNQSNYNFKPGKIYNLKADNCIKDHSDICKKEVANVVIKAIR